MLPAEDAGGRALRSFAAAMVEEATHELNNRLATMRETVGLLEDLARAGKAGAAGAGRAQASLDSQVGRCLNLVRALGGFGRALAGADASFDAGAAIGDLLELTGRWAHRRSVTIERDIAAGLPRAAGDAALFLCLVHRLVCRCAEALPPAGGMVLRAASDGAAIRVSLAPKGGRADRGAAKEADEEELGRELARRLGGELTLEGGGAATITLAVVR